MLHKRKAVIISPPSNFTQWLRHEDSRLTYKIGLLAFDSEQLLMPENAAFLTLCLRLLLAQLTVSVSISTCPPLLRHLRGVGEGVGEGSLASGGIPLTHVSSSRSGLSMTPLNCHLKSCWVFLLLFSLLFIFTFSPFSFSCIKSLSGYYDIKEYS